MVLRAKWVGAVLLATAVATTGCSGSSDADSATTTTTSTTSPASVATTAPPKVTEPPGLWLATATGVVDELGERFASPTPGTGEYFRSLVDDGAGGVFYLRCVEPDGALATPDELAPNESSTTLAPSEPVDTGTGTCQIEHAVEPNGTPTLLGTAQELFGAGRWGDAAVIVAAIEDSTGDGTANDPGVTTTSPTTAQADTNDAASAESVGALLDAESGAVVATFDWYVDGGEPVAVDVSKSLLVGCVGAGEECTIVSSEDPAVPPVPVDGIAGDVTVSSLVLDSEAATIAWVEVERMGGTVTVIHRDLASGNENRDELRGPDEAQATDAVTDGRWAAVRVGETVYLSELLDGVGTGSRTVPPTTTEIALRSDAASSGLASRL